MTEQEQIKEAFEDLLKSLRKETSKENRQKIKEAFEFANEAHKGVKRRSGELTLSINKKQNYEKTSNSIPVGCSVVGI